MAQENGEKGGARKEPMIDQSNRPTAVDFDTEISQLKVRDLSALVGAHVEALKAEKEGKSEKEKEVLKLEKEWSKPEKEVLKGEKEKEWSKPEKEKEIRKPEKEFSKPEKEAFKPEKEFSKPEKEALKGEKEKEVLKPEGLKPELKPDPTIEQITQAVVDRVMAELQRRGAIR